MVTCYKKPAALQLKGLYPESHGIVDNHMYDVTRNATFSLKVKEKFNPSWYQGQPIWLTAKYHNLKSGTFFWPGSDVAINETYPDIYQIYNRSIPFEERISTLLKWLSLPSEERSIPFEERISTLLKWLSLPSEERSIPFEERISTLLKWLSLPSEERPDMITLYLEEPDSSGHRFGPVSSAVIQALIRVDKMVAMLMDGLKQRNLHNCVNLVLLSDHVDYEGIVKNLSLWVGCMAGLQSEKKQSADGTHFGGQRVFVFAAPESAQGCSGLAAWRAYRVKRSSRLTAHILEDSMCSSSPLQSQRRGGSGEVDYEGIVKNLSCKTPGQNFKPYMKQHLPKRFHFARNIRIEPVHFYMNSQWQAAQTIFIGHGPGITSKNKVEPFENIEVYNLLCDLLNITPAPNNGTHGSLNHILKRPVYSPVHPTEVSSPDICSVTTLLPTDTLGCQCSSHSNPEESVSSLQPESVDCLRADVRIPANQSQSCLSHKKDPNLTFGFLHPPNLGPPSRKSDSLITSNTVPMYTAFKDSWIHFHSMLLLKYAKERNGLNVISGPVFDYNYDGHFDTSEQLKQNIRDTKILIPTHYFVVLTSCKNSSYPPEACNGSLDVSSFIIPHRPDNTESCTTGTDLHWVEEWLKFHVARVRDIELLTGLSFYQDRRQPVTEILQLKTFLQTFQNED
ncbi:UNVERIFIED_CONTAM: hypothetical protein FKN15_009751 [Acipenser sinensis]